MMGTSGMAMPVAASPMRSAPRPAPVTAPIPAPSAAFVPSSVFTAASRGKHRVRVSSDMSRLTSLSVYPRLVTHS
jgi:hypothetical protein